ncbi:MAG: MFS transporter, partial [Planctomycetota bacterium]
WTFAFVAACLVLFGIQRSLGETGFYPWMKEFVPDAVRGRAQGTATVLGSLAAGAGMGLVSWLVGNRDALHLGRFGPFQLAYLVFAGAGLLGVLGTSRLPGGHAPQRARPSAGGSGFARRLTASLRDRRFAAFLLATGILQGSMVLFAGLMPLYMNDIVGLAERHVVLLSIAQMGGAVTAGFVCGRAADRYGSRRMLFLLLGAMAMMPALWAALPLLGVARTVAAYAAYLLFGTSLVGANIAAIRMMYNSVVPDAKKTEYLAVRYALVGLVAGTMPLLAGHSVEAFAPLTGKKLLGLPLNPYLPLFACCAVAWVGCAMIFARIHDNPRHAARPSDQTI